MEFDKFEDFYGKPVQLNDKIGSVFRHWNRQIAIKNQGKFTPTLITSEEYELKLKEIQEKLKDKYVIIDIRNMDFMKDSKGNIHIYDNYEDARYDCFFNEPENAWIMKLIDNYVEPY